MQKSVIPIPLTRTLDYLHQCRAKSCLKLSEILTSFVGRRQKLSSTLRLHKADRHQWVSPTTGSLLGYSTLTVEYQMLLTHSSLNFYWILHLLLVAIPPVVWYNLLAVSASCSSLVAALTDQGAVCFNLFAESSPPCCSRPSFLISLHFTPIVFFPGWAVLIFSHSMHRNGSIYLIIVNSKPRFLCTFSSSVKSI